jgi:hypothetical protein
MDRDAAREQSVAVSRAKALYNEFLYRKKLEEVMKPRTRLSAGRR